MFAIVRSAALSAVLALAALPLAQAPAHAGGGGLYLGFGSSHDRPGFGFRFDDRGHYRHRDRHGPRHSMRGCSPRAAVARASEMGMRRARVVHAGPRTVTVQGRVRGHGFAVMTFSRAPHCPRIR